MTQQQLNNIKNSIKELEDTYLFQFDSDLDICVDLSENVTVLRVILKESFFDSYEFKIPKIKPVTAEYIINKVLKLQNKVYINYTDVFKTLLYKIDFDKKLNATSYGLGMDVLFTSWSDQFKDLQKASDKLNEYGIKHSLSCSEAAYVRRLLISKSKENIDRIKNL